MNILSLFFLPSLYPFPSIPEAPNCTLQVPTPYPTLTYPNLPCPPRQDVSEPKSPRVVVNKIDEALRRETMKKIAMIMTILVTKDDDDKIFQKFSQAKEGQTIFVDDDDDDNDDYDDNDDDADDDNDDEYFDIGKKFRRAKEGQTIFVEPGVYQVLLSSQ